MSGRALMPKCASVSRMVSTGDPAPDSTGAIVMQMDGTRRYSKPRLSRNLRPHSWRLYLCLSSYLPRYTPLRL